MSRCHCCDGPQLRGGVVDAPPIAVRCVYGAGVTVRIWQAFACNNSTSYRLVARFTDAATASAVRDEVRALVATDREELAARYGIAWDDLLADGSAHDNPDATEVAAIDGVLVAYHDYCLGYGPALPDFLRARGAAVTAGEMGAPSVSVRFAYAGGNAALDAELDAILAQIARVTPTSRDALAVPWTSARHYSGLPVAGFRDARSVGLHVPVAPDDLAAVRDWLAGHGITNLSLQLCEESDAAKFAAIGRARCTACGGALVYLDPRLGDPEAEPGSDLLVCYPCGGLYDLATFDGS
jgi:hypothetical protein